MIVTTPQEVLNTIFDKTIQAYIFYEGNVDELWSFLDEEGYEYEMCGCYSNDYTLYHIRYTFEQSGILGIKDS